MTKEYFKKILIESGFTDSQYRWGHEQEFAVENDIYQITMRKDGYNFVTLWGEGRPQALLHLKQTKESFTKILTFLNLTNNSKRIKFEEFYNTIENG